MYLELMRFSRLSRSKDYNIVEKRILFAVNAIFSALEINLTLPNTISPTDRLKMNLLPEMDDRNVGQIVSISYLMINSKILFEKVSLFSWMRP